MVVYRDTDLQQYKLEAQLFLLPEVVQAMGYDTSRFDIADLLHFFSHSEMLANSYWVRFASLVSLCLSCQLPMPSASARSPPLKRVKTYLRSTTGDGRPNHLMLLDVYKELADGIDNLEVANLFVGRTISGASNCLGSFQNCRWSLRLPLRQIRQFSNYELTVMTLKGEKFAGFKIQR